MRLFNSWNKEDGLMNNFKIVVLIIIISIFTACNSGKQSKQNPIIQYDTIKVTATAYNSLESQTKKGNPAIAAWGDTLKPGMNAIAISRDFLNEDLLGHNSVVKIEGLDSTYRVLDKMNKRWTRKIDVYMGLDVETARNWGKQQVEIYIPVDTVP
ncbi:MAG: 3D domain-containing protein [Bacteroidota bacterium]